MTFSEAEEIIRNMAASACMVEGARRAGASAWRETALAAAAKYPVESAS